MLHIFKSKEELFAADWLAESAFNFVYYVDIIYGISLQPQRVDMVLHSSGVVSAESLSYVIRKGFGPCFP